MAYLDIEELTRQAEEQGVPLNLVSEYYRANASNPQVKGISPARIVQGIGMAANTALTGKFSLNGPERELKYAKGGEVLANPVDAPLPTAYAGPVGQGPQAAADIGLEQLKQMAAANTASYRPEEMAAAQAAYNKRAALPGQSAGLLAAGFGGMDVARQNDLNVEAANKLALQQTVGAVQDRQKYATQGIDNYKKGVDAAGLVVDQLEKSGKFEIDQKKAQLDQKKLQLELVGTQANAQQTQRLMDPSTVDSAAVRMAAKTFLQQSGMYSAKQIEQMVPPDMSGIQAAPIAKLGGESLDMLVKKNLAQAHAGQAAASYGQAAASRAEAAKRGAEQRTIEQGQDIVANETGIAVPGRAMPQVQGGQGQWDEATMGPRPTKEKMALSVSGGVPTLNQAQHIEQKRRDAAKQIDTSANFIGTYDSKAANIVRNAYNAADRMAGYKGQNIANIKNDPAVVKYRNDINALNSIAESMGLVVPGESSKTTQGALSALGTAAASTGNPYAVAGGTVLSAASPFFGSSQPLTEKSPPQAIKDMVTKIEIVKEQQKRLLPYQRQFAEGTQFGSMDKFYQTPIYKSTLNAVPIQNKSTGEIRLLDMSRDVDVQEASKLKQSGEWAPVQGYTGNVR